MADFSDTSGVQEQAADARAIGTSGGYAVHPAQIAVLNDVFSPSEDEIAWARKVLEAADKAGAEGRGVFKVEGQMIDKPLIDRAAAILRGQ